MCVCKKFDLALSNVIRRERKRELKSERENKRGFSVSSSTTDGTEEKKYI